MTVSSVPGSTPRLEGNGATNQWQFGFDVASADDLDVVRISEGGGSTLIDPDLYLVALNEGGDLGGTVTYPLDASRVPEGAAIVIRLAPEFTQPTRLRDEGPYSPERVEGALDHLERQIKANQTSAEGLIREPLGTNIIFAPPIDGAALFYRLLSTGEYQITPGTPDETASGTPADLRILYANDLGLRADGTDETAEINAKLLEYSRDDGRQVLIYLQSAAGYWPLTAELKVRSGISLTFGSPLRATKDGCVSFTGGLARNPTGALVAVAASAGATTVAATPVSGSLSSQFAVGDQVEIGSGTNRVRITGIDSELNSLSITPLLVAVAIGATVRKFVFSYCTAGWGRHDTPTIISVQDETLFPIGSMVWITDDDTTLHSDGVQRTTLNHEMATIIGYGTGSIRVNRSIRHWMSTGDLARVHLVDPCEHAVLAGATVEFVEAPDETVVNTFIASFAFRCRFVECSVPNRDNFGTRGRSFNLDRCYDCEVVDCFSGRAKYVNSGEGYGVSLVKSTECRVDRYIGSGSRHVVSFIGSTDCTATDVTGTGWIVNLIDFHGQKEIGCWAYETQGSGINQANAAGVSLGNSSWRGGTYECGVEQGEITDLGGSEARGVVVWGPADDCDVSGIVFRRISRGIDIRDPQGGPSVEIGRIRIACDFHRCDESGLVNMNFYGSTAKPLNRLDLSGSRWFDWAAGLLIDNVDDLVMVGIHMETTRASTTDYAMTLADCGAAIVSGYFEGCHRLASTVNVPLRLEHYTIRNPGSGVVIEDFSLSPVSGGIRDAWGSYPAGFSPVRTSAVSTLTVLSLPGMS